MISPFGRHRLEKERVRDNRRQDWLAVFEEHNESFIERVNVGVNDSPGAVGEENLVIHLFKSSRSPALCCCGAESSASKYAQASSMDRRGSSAG